MEYRGSNAGTDDISADRMKRQRSVEPVFNRRQASSSESSDSESEAAGAVALPDQPIHGGRESLFSSSSEFYNFRGLLNDFIILLVLSNARAIIKNLLTYGILVDPVSAVRVFLEDPYTWPSVCLCIVSPVFALFALLCEKAISSWKISEKAVLILHVINLAVILVFPVVVNLLGEPSPVGALWALLTYTILWLKMVSYVQVNYWCRRDQETSKKMLQDNEELKKQNLVWYPSNLTFLDMLYFLWAPTLCYELNFPRRPNIRKIFLLRRLIESVFLMNFLFFSYRQWILPIAKSSVKPFKEMDYGSLIERILTLAVPNHLLWLLGFYCVFHSVLNFLAELLKFGDREFYKDWWNSKTIAKFWQTWNIPVHRWASRHVYKPMIRMGYGRLSASLAVFFISAFFHEYLISIPLHMFRLWAFTAMIMQIPLAMVTSLKFIQGQIGNCIVWTSIVLGHPIAIIMYMHDYYILHLQPQEGVGGTM